MLWTTWEGRSDPEGLAHPKRLPDSVIKYSSPLSPLSNQGGSVSCRRFGIRPEGKPIFSVVVKARGSPSESPPQQCGLSYLPKAKGMDKEVRGRLSGHGFSTERREERGRMRSEFPRWGNERADESMPEPYILTFIGTSAIPTYS
jgi:hypothetical protein